MYKFLMRINDKILTTSLKIIMSVSSILDSCTVIDIILIYTWYALEAKSNE